MFSYKDANLIKVQKKHNIKHLWIKQCFHPISQWEQKSTVMLLIIWCQISKRYENGICSSMRNHWGPFPYLINYFHFWRWRYYKMCIKIGRLKHINHIQCRHLGRVELRINGFALLCLDFQRRKINYTENNST